MSRENSKKIGLTCRSQWTAMG